MKASKFSCHGTESDKILVVADFMSAKTNNKRNLKIATTFNSLVLGQTYNSDCQVRYILNQFKIEK